VGNVRPVALNTLSQMVGERPDDVRQREGPERNGYSVSKTLTDSAVRVPLCTVATDFLATAVCRRGDGCCGPRSPFKLEFRLCTAVGPTTIEPGAVSAYEQARSLAVAGRAGDRD